MFVQGDFLYTQEKKRGKNGTKSVALKVSRDNNAEKRVNHVCVTFKTGSSHPNPGRTRFVSRRHGRRSSPTISFNFPLDPSTTVLFISKCNDGNPRVRLVLRANSGNNYESRLDAQNVRSISGKLYRHARDVRENTHTDVARLLGIDYSTSPKVSDLSNVYSSRLRVSSGKPFAFEKPSLSSARASPLNYLLPLPLDSADDPSPQHTHTHTRKSSVVAEQNMPTIKIYTKIVRQTE